MDQRNLMNIVVSLNANYLKPLCVMLCSLLDANPGGKVDVYVLHASLTPEDFAFVRAALSDTRLSLFDVRVPEAFMADAPVLFHFPKEMYYRIFSVQLLPASLGRALYLDPDMVVNRPLAPLYRMEMGSNFFAAARAINTITQKEYKPRLNMPEESEYFNSGVLLMNLSELRESQNCDEAMAFISSHREKLILPDQDVLNALYYDRTILLDPHIYNFDARYFNTVKVATLGKVDLKWVRENTAIIHYCGKGKPWHEYYLGELGVFYREVAAKVFPEEAARKSPIEKLRDELGSILESGES